MLSDVGVGICGNLATIIIKNQSESLRSSIAGRAIVKMGLLDPSFEDVFETALRKAFETYYHAHPFLKMTKVVDFLSHDSTINNLRGILFNGHPIDYADLENQLADILDVRNLEPNAWPAGVHPSKIIDDLLVEVRSSLLREAHPALAVISRQIYDIDNRSKRLAA